jgi:hypothetical protein
VSPDPAAPRVVYVMRHGEKPPDTPPPDGVDDQGVQNEHSLITLGWQRSGALATLFAPFLGPLRAGIVAPTELIAPSYPKHESKERTHQTLSAISARLDVAVTAPYAEGSETELGQWLAAATTGVTLVCWEHHAIPAIAAAIIPPIPGTPVPTRWPGDRFDMVWSFTRAPGADTYTFAQIPELLLAGDSPDPIPPPNRPPAT